MSVDLVMPRQVHNHFLLTKKIIAVGFITLTESGQNSIIIVGGANMHYPDLTKLPAEYYEAIDKCNRKQDTSNNLG